MELEINRDTIKAFILNELSNEMMSLVANAMITDMYLAEIYEEERFKIDAKLYYRNLLSPTDQIKFEQQLLKRMELFNRVNQPKKMNSSSEELLLKEQLEETFSTYEASQKQERRIPKMYTKGINIKHWLVAASFAVLLIAGGGLVYHSQTDDSLENRLYAKYYAPLSDFNDYILDNNSFIVAKQKYKDGEYTNALLILKSLPSYITIEAERNMFIGLSSMEIGRYKMAVGYFEEILTNQSTFDYIPQVKWYLGLCYLKLGNKEKAVETFNAIVSSNNDYSKKAKQILRRIYD